MIRGVEPEHELAVAYVGTLGVRDRTSKNPAFSQAGTMFQERLVEHLVSAGLPITRIYSLRPEASFPVGRRLFHGLERGGSFFGAPATFLPCINVGALKILTSGLALIPLLLAWAWRSRRSRRAVILYNVNNPPGIASLLAARLSGTRVIVIAADMEVPGSGSVRDTFLRRIDFFMHKFTLARADALVVLTRQIASDFAPSVRSILLEGGVLENGGAPDLRAAPAPGDLSTEDSFPRETDREFVMMYAGQLSQMKGIPVLLDAFRRLPGPNLRLWITGMGPLQGTVEAAAGEDSRIVFRGMVDYAELEELYRRASVLVNPHSSRFMTARYVFPSKLLEYIATGTPVVTTSSTPEVTEEYGDVVLLADCDDAASLARALATAAAMPAQELAALGERARNFVKAKKSWKAQAERVAALVRNVALGEPA